MEINNGEFIHIRRLSSSDAENVYNYLQALSPSSKKRFGPHPFDQESVAAVLSDTGNMTAYGAFENNSGDLIAYSLIRHGVISHDKDRYQRYGITLCETTDCTFAPSVADAWQNKKIGSKVFNFILSDLSIHLRRMVLWGGVQADNVIAVNFYRRKNFQLLGEFEHNGNNFDMMLSLHR